MDLFVRLCYRKRQLVDSSGGLAMPQVPLRFLSVAKRCTVCIKNSINTTTAVQRDASLRQTASRLGEALESASMLKVVIIRMDGEIGNKDLSKSDGDFKVILDNLPSLPNLPR